MIHYYIHPVNPQVRLLESAADILKNQDGICIYPTDTVYGMGACADNPKALDKIGAIINKDKKRLFSFICCDFSQVSRYVRISNKNYKIMKHYLPGPFTFILPATNFVPKKVCPRRKTVGIRIPHNKACIDLIKILGVPLANTSINIPGQFRGDPSMFISSLSSGIDVILDVGMLDTPVGSTIVDLTGEDPVIVRAGKGAWHG